MAWTDYYVAQSDDSASNGAGSAADPWTSLRAAVAEIGVIGGPTRIFVRGSGSTLGSALNISTTGTAANPVAWIGCTGTGTTWTRIGDSASAAKPTLATATYGVTISGSYSSFEGLGFTGSPTTALVVVSGNYNALKRCRCINSAASAAAYALHFTGAVNRVFASYVQADATTCNYTMPMSEGTIHAFGNIIVGGKTAAVLIQVGYCQVMNNLIFGMGNPGDGIRVDVAGGRSFIYNNTIYGGHEDGIRITQGMADVVNNLCVGTGNMDYPINYSNLPASHNNFIAYNAWYSVTYNKINGIVETQETHTGASADFGNLIWNYGLLAGDPLPNASAGNFLLAEAYRGLAFPGAFEAGDSIQRQGLLSHGAMQPGMPSPAELAAAMWSNVTSPNRQLTS